jgi:regulator of sigma E protease
VNGTEYVVSAIPLGGFVKMVGEDPDAEEPVDPRISFSHQPLWKRAAIVIAGPAFNLLFAFLVFAGVFFTYGARIPSEVAKVGGVLEDKPASRAELLECPAIPACPAGWSESALRPDDVVVRVGDRQVATWEELATEIRDSGGREVELLIERDGRLLAVRVTPESEPDRSLFGEDQGEVYRIGIERGLDQEEVGLVGAVTMGAKQTLWWGETVIVGLVKALQRKISAQDIGGPILIVQAASEQARNGFESLLHFMAVISINLGILNLLPIPILDGGHLLFITLETVMRRPLDTRHREIAQQVGLVILLCLMAFAFYNDIGRVIRGWG